MSGPTPPQGSGVAGDGHDDGSARIDAELKDVAAKIAAAIAAEPPKVWLSGQDRPFHGALIVARRWLSLVVLTLAGIACASCFAVLPAWPTIGLGVAALSFGLALHFVLQAELLRGTGTERHDQYAKGDRIWREYKFRSSLSRPVTLLLLLGAGVVANILGAAAAYAGIARMGVGHFSNALDGASAIYFSVVTFATVGYGDLVPVTALARGAVALHIATSFVSVVVVLGTAISWLVTQTREQAEEVRRRREEDMREAEAVFARAGVGLYSDAGKAHIAELSKRMTPSVPPPRLK